MANNLSMIKKLQMALNAKGMRILYNSTQFYSNDLNHPITIHVIKKAVYNEIKGRNDNIELFKSSSMIQIILFLRDLLYEVDGKEIPNNNPIWAEKKAQYMESVKKESANART